MHHPYPSTYSQNGGLALCQVRLAEFDRGLYWSSARFRQLTQNSVRLALIAANRNGRGLNA